MPKTHRRAVRAVDEECARIGGRHAERHGHSPRTAWPSYEVLRTSGGPRCRPGAAARPRGGNGPRVWNVFKF